MDLVPRLVGRYLTGFDRPLRADPLFRLALIVGVLGATLFVVLRSAPGLAVRLALVPWVVLVGAGVTGWSLGAVRSFARDLRGT